MAAWVVRAGQHQGRQRLALNEGLVTIGWKELDDLGGFATQRAIAEQLMTQNPAQGKRSAGNHAQQLWAFSHRIEVDDLLMLVQSDDRLAFGVVTGSYLHRGQDADEYRHGVRVRWIAHDVTRDKLEPDVGAKLSNQRTIFEIGPAAED